jgi:hypothetical protein
MSKRTFLTLIAPHALLVFVLLAGLWIRLVDIAEYYYNPDEMSYLMIAQGATLAEVWDRGLNELHPPLAHFARHYLLTFFGDVALVQRMFGVAVSLVAIAAAYRLGTAVQPPYAGPFLALCVALLPVTVSIAQTIRNYSPFVALLILALRRFVRYQRHHNTNDLSWFAALMVLASATHFTGFLVAMACCIQEGVRQLHARRFRSLAILCACHVPLLALGVVLYFYYLAPGAVGPLWSAAAEANGGLPTDVGSRFLRTVVVAPFVLAPIDDGVGAGPSAFVLRFVLGIVFVTVCVQGWRRLNKDNAPLAALAATAVAVALLASTLNVYPLYPGRQSVYLLVFLLIPIWYGSAEAWGWVDRRRWAKVLVPLLVTATVLLAREAGAYRQYGDEHVIRTTDHQASFAFIDDRARTGDVVVPSLWSYSYALYRQDRHARYDEYADGRYASSIPMVGPFNAPLRRHSTWHAFGDALTKALTAHARTRDVTFWFVTHSWDSAPGRLLFECEAVRPFIVQYFRQGGAFVYGVSSSGLRAVLRDRQRLEPCFAGYVPLTFATPIPPTSSPLTIDGARH